MPDQPTPSVGRVVHYVPTSAERDQIKAGGGNPLRPGEPVKADIVAVFGPSGVANLRLTVDGPPHCDLWVTSVYHGTGERTWSYPPRA